MKNMELFLSFKCMVINIIQEIVDQHDNNNDKPQYKFQEMPKCLLFYIGSFLDQVGIVLMKQLNVKMYVALNQSPLVYISDKNCIKQLVIKQILKSNNYYH